MKEPITAIIKMKRCFADVLHNKMRENADIWVVTADLGYKMWDQIRIDYPDRFLNVGAAEQTMVGVGIGLALEGKIPFVYSIATFLLYRPFETIRNYINYERIPVKLIGAGRDKDYAHDGFSHWAQEDKAVMRILANINSKWPQDNEEIPNLIEEMIKNNKPYYVNLKK